jgi:large subunit ribosomal protein L23
MSNNHLYDLIRRPLLTEKTRMLSVKHGQYVFEVLPSANKIELKKAFEALFPGRKVVGIQTTKIYPKQKRVGRRLGHTSVSKKAIFTVQGEPLEIFAGA